MFRILLAVILSAVLMQAWGFVSWMVLSWHDPTMRSVGDTAAEDKLVSFIEQAQLDQAGWYYWPKMPEDWGDAETMKAYETRHQSIPVGHLIVSPAGQEVMPPKMWGYAVGGNAAAALCLCIVVVLAGSPSFFKRYAIVLLVGGVGVLTSELPQWNWMRFPADYSLVMAADRMIVVALAGLVIATLVRPGRTTTAGQPVDS